MEMTQRHFCLESIAAAMTALQCGSPQRIRSEAVELEHAVYVTASACPMMYPHLVLKAVHLLTHGRLLLLRRATDGQSGGVRSYVDLLAWPSKPELYGQMPCVESCASAEALREQGEALLRDLNSPDLSNIPDAGTRCAKCKSSDISFDFLQTRAADEGTTVYCTCTACGKRWKM